MRVTKAMVEKASRAYAEKRHPSRWDGEPWGEAGRLNHAAAIKNVLKSVEKDSEVADNTKALLEVAVALTKISNLLAEMIRMEKKDD